MRRLLSLAAATALILTVAGQASAAAGPPSLSFYVDGVRYRTVATPTDLTATGAPDWSFDAIYALGGDLINVAEAKPGDTDFNGGRWKVLPVTWHVAAHQLFSAEEVLAAADAGELTIATTPIREFVCTVNRVPAGAA